MRIQKTARRLMKRWGAPALAVAASLLSTAEAFGVQDTRLTGEDKGILQWLLAFGIVVLMAAVGFLNPKRSHLD
jgi:hypothetical protein